MSAAVKITLRDHTAIELRAFAAKCRDAMQSRRLLAIAMLVDGSPRLTAARQTGMDRQTLRDWVHRSNETGLSGLMSRSPPGPTPRLTKAQMTELRELVVAGPDPQTHQVVALALRRRARRGDPALLGDSERADDRQMAAQA